VSHVEYRVDHREIADEAGEIDNAVLAETLTGAVVGGVAHAVVLQ
jgi:hypothetical protein